MDGCGMPNVKHAYPRRMCIDWGSKIGSTTGEVSIVEAA
jgi:hypothetical protein